jgi:L-lactate dehydrogenase complex protein LldG
LQTVDLTMNSRSKNILASLLTGEVSSIRMKWSDHYEGIWGMSQTAVWENFETALGKAGAVLESCEDFGAAIAYIRKNAGGDVLVPDFPTARRFGLVQALIEAGCVLVDAASRQEAPRAVAGVTGANFAIADTGTLVLESTAEAVRMSTTLPERHFVLLDPRKIVADGAAAVPWMRRMHQERPQAFLAWITGPSRTADIERVLTIGVHGPRELHVLLVEGLSDDFLEM